MKTQKLNMTTGRAAAIGAAVLALIVAGGPAANASLLIEEGFPAGGASPAAGQYQSDPDSVTGANAGVADGDSILFQGPSGAVGFNAGVVWDEMVGVGSIVYPRVLDTGLDYTDGLGNTLNTTVGAADWHRTAGGPGLKVATRATNLPTGSGNELPATAYFSALMQFTSGLTGQIELHQLNRELVFGFDASGHVQVDTQGAGDVGAPVSGTDVFAADTTHLVFGVVSDGAPDSVSIWVDPADLSDPTAGLASLTTAAFGSGWVVNPSYTIDALHLAANLVAGDQFIFDEVRVGETAADVLPFTPVPEPSTLVLAALAVLCLAARRRQRA